VAVSTDQRWTQQGLGRKAEFSEEQREALLALHSQFLSLRCSVSESQLGTFDIFPGLLPG